MGREEQIEKSRQESAEAQATADREREVARRTAREEQAKQDVSIVVHSPAQD